MDEQGSGGRLLTLMRKPHYHVIYVRQGAEKLVYTDPLEHDQAIKLVLELVAPKTGRRQRGLQKIWIAEAGENFCPLAHGNEPESDEALADQFLTDAMSNEPLWSRDGEVRYALRSRDGE